MNKQLAIAAWVALAVAACDPDQNVAGPAPMAAKLNASDVAAEGGRAAVFTLMNRTAANGGNAVAIFSRAEDGSLTAAGTVLTGGNGTGAGLGSQGAVALSENGAWLYAVNAGSNDISMFRVDRGQLTLTSRFASGGTTPTSLTVHDHVLYVLNAGGTGNITGFRLDDHGGAQPIAGSTRGLSGPASTVAPAEVAFNNDGHWLVVTEKSTSLLDVYPVDPRGVAGARTSFAAAGVTPYGFAFGNGDDLFASEASGTASSYEFRHGALSTVSGAVPTHQGAPCWLAVNHDGHFAYTANAASGTISGFRVGSHGSLTLLDASGVTAAPGAGNLDLTFDHNGKYLYQLRSNGTITGYRLAHDGHLTLVGVVGAMPGSVSGLAAR